MLRTGLFVGAAPSGDGSDGLFPQGARLALAGLVNGPGVLTGGAVTGLTTGPNMSYSLAAGVFACARGTQAADGLYVFANDGPVTVDSGVPAPSSGSRWDLIWVQARNGFDGGFGDPSSLPVAGVLPGAAGSVPVKPYGAGQGAGGASLPAGALVIAEASVGQGIGNASAASISQVAAAVTGRGGVARVPAVASLPASPVAGTAAYTAAEHTLWLYDGSAWQPYTRSAGVVASQLDSVPVSVPVAAGVVPITAYNTVTVVGSDITFAGGVATVARGGLYRWSASVEWPVWPTNGTPSGVIVLAQVNGANNGSGRQQGELAGHRLSMTAGDVLWLAPGDRVQLGLDSQDADLTTIFIRRFALTT